MNSYTLYTYKKFLVEVSLRTILFSVEQKCLQSSDKICAIYKMLQKYAPNLSLVLVQ